MLYCLPVSHYDRDRLTIKAALFKFLGANPGHHLMVVFTQDVEATDIAAFKKEVDSLFDSVTSHQVTVKRGWPLGSNQLFRETAKLALARGMPWMFGELDGDPVKRGWLESLAREHRESRKDFMGAVVPTRGFVQGRDGTMEPVTQGEHMVGFGIYPANFVQRSVRLPTIDVVMMWAPNQKMTPFDIELRYETTPFAHNTKLIQHNLRTVNYRVNEDGQIVCDNHPENPESANHAKPVDPRAVIVHGCKDDSLALLVMNGIQSKFVEKIEEPKVEIPALDAEQVATSEPTEPKPHVTPPSFKAFQIHQILKNGKGWRVPQLAEELKWTEEDVRAVIAEESSNLGVAQLGWVKPRNAES